MIKKYFGEKFAFFYTYFLSYTAFLVIPGIVGLGLTIWEFVVYPSARTLDSPYNHLMGVIIAIWSVFFVQTWKSQQNRMIYEWDMDTPQDVLMNDARPEFKYKNFYCR